LDQDLGGLLSITADVESSHFDTKGNISVYSDVDQGCLTDLPENVVSWIQFKAFKLFNILY
jgi:hypothetical protein